jgi:hypothetical protein
LGHFQEWPTHVLELLFCAPPTPVNIRDVSAFLFGNGLPLKFAIQLYGLVNDNVIHATTLSMRTYYNLWFYDSAMDHHAIYYNVKQKIYVDKRVGSPPIRSMRS